METESNAIPFHRLDGGIWNYEDIHKKFNKCIVLAQIINGETKTECPMLFTGIGADGVQLRSTFQSPDMLFSKFVAKLVAERPQAGLINSSIFRRPFLYEYSPARQWRRGVCEDNSIIRDVLGQSYSIFKFEVPHWEDFFKPTYPKVEVAVKELLEKKRKHYALDNTISILRGNKRLVLLKKFIPFLSINNGMFFKIPSSANILKRETEYYEHLFKQTFGSNLTF